MLNKSRSVLISIVLGSFVIGLMIVTIRFFPRHYYRDRLVILGQDQGTDFTVVLELTRYEFLPLVYMHTYTLNYLTPEQSYSQLATQQTLSSMVEPQKFLTAFTNLNDYNTSEEDYEVHLQFADQNLTINLQNLTGDFIVNNAAERLTYVDMGTTTITLNDQTMPVAYMLSKGSSSDAAAVSLADEAEYFGQHSFFATERGDLYLVDASTVDHNTTNYVSHTWLLHKDPQGYLKKTINHAVTLTHTDACNQIVNLASERQLTSTELNLITHDQETLCLVDGFDQAADQTSPLLGLAMFKE